MLLLLVWLLVVGVSVQHANGYCLGIGANPKWTGPPSVQQINMSAVLVSWEGLISRVDCADQFLVKSGLVAAPSEFKLSPMMTTDHFNFVFTDRSPENEYFYQVIAREDKGFRGIEYNRSPETLFTTSRRNGNLRPELVPIQETEAPIKARIDDSKDDESKTLQPMHVLKKEEEETDFLQDYLVWVVVGGLVVLLILVGIIYNIRKKQKGKSIDLDLESHPSEGEDEEDDRFYAEDRDEDYDLNEEEEEDYESEKSEHSVSQKSADRRSSDQEEDEELKSLKSQK